MSVIMKQIILFTTPWLQMIIIFLVQTSHGYILIGNGHIYTVDSNNSKVEAVAMDTSSGKIIVTGAFENIRNQLGNEEEYWDLNGKMMLPGFQDAHLHAVEAGINARMCYVDEDADIFEIADFYFGDPQYCSNGGRFGDQGWIVGSGIDISLLVESVSRNRYESPRNVLDQSYPNIPVLILDNLGHGAVVNSRALELTGYSSLIGDPPGGKIDRDSFGTPTGIVRENAQQAFRNAAFPPTPINQDIAYESLKDALKTLAANGITTVSDAGGFWQQAQTETWSRAEEEGILTVRASNALYVYPEIPITTQLTDLTRRFSNDPNKLVRFNQAKIYVDGILSLLTSAVNEPYASSLMLPEMEQLGFEYFGNSSNLSMVSQLLINEGFQLHFHATGDRATTTALDVIEATSNGNDGPHRLTHCYLVNEADYVRFKDLNVIADFQLSPSSLDIEYEQFISTILDSTRASKLLPASEIYEGGGMITISSDWDADILSPLTKLQFILNRRNGKSIPNLTTAIEMMTINPAQLLQHEMVTGSIVVDKFADFVIIDKDLYNIDSTNSIESEATIVATIMGGTIVFDPDGFLNGNSVGNFPRNDGTPPSLRKIAFVCALTLSLTFLFTIYFYDC